MLLRICMPCFCRADVLNLLLRGGVKTVSSCATGSQKLPEGDVGVECSIILSGCDGLSFSDFIIMPFAKMCFFPATASPFPARAFTKMSTFSIDRALKSGTSLVPQTCLKWVLKGNLPLFTKQTGRYTIYNSKSRLWVVWLWQPDVKTMELSIHPSMYCTSCGAETAHWGVRSKVGKFHKNSFRRHLLLAPYQSQPNRMKREFYSSILGNSLWPFWFQDCASLKVRPLHIH